MRLKTIAALIAGLFRPRANTTSLAGTIFDVPAGIVADSSGAYGLFGLMNNLNLFDLDLLALVSSSLAITLTGAQIAQNNIIDHSGAPGSGVTVTTDTAANIIAAMPNTTPRAGINFLLYYMNDGLGQTVTLAAGSGVTIIGTATIGTNTLRQFLVNVNANAGTVTMVNMGTQNL